MNFVHTTLTILLTTITCFAQGRVNFANRVDNVVDVPISLSFTQYGPGPGFSAQLYLVTGSSLTPLTPISTFHSRGAGTEAISDRYWESKIVDVPVQPGTDATFIVRAWETSLGTYELAIGFGGAGQSDPFIVTVGGGGLPVANLATLKSFVVAPAWPEPPTITIGLLGALVVVVYGRRP